jgi:hypothetical protein
VKKDLNRFYYSLIQKYIEGMDKWEIFSAKDIRENLLINDKFIKDTLKKIKKEWNLIKWASWFSRYEVIKE